MRLNFSKVCVLMMVVLLLGGCSPPVAAPPLSITIDGVGLNFTRSQVVAKLGPPKRLQSKGKTEVLEFPLGDGRYITACEFLGDELIAIRGKTLVVGTSTFDEGSSQSDIEKVLGRPISSDVQHEPGESEEIKTLRFSPSGIAELEASLFDEKFTSFYARR